MLTDMITLLNPSYLLTPSVVLSPSRMSLAADLFIRINPPRLILPPSSKRLAARIARDFASFVDGVTEQYNANHGTELSAAEGLVELLNSDVTPDKIFADYREDAEKARGWVSSSWGNVGGFRDGWKYMTPKFARWFIYNALPHPYQVDEHRKFEGRPDLSKALIEHPKGEPWMEGFVKELRLLLYGK